MPKAWWCGRRHHRRGHAQSERRRGAEPRAASGYTGQDAWRTQADRLLDGLLPLAAENLFMHLALLNALDLRLRAAEIVVARDDARARSPPPRASCPSSTASSCCRRTLRRLPAQEKIAAITEPAAFVCVGERCSLPVTRADGDRRAVAAMRGEHQAGASGSLG